MKFEFDNMFDNVKGMALKKAKAKAFDKLIADNTEFKEQITKYDHILDKFQFTKEEQAKIYRIIAYKLLNHADDLDPEYNN